MNADEVRDEIKRRWRELWPHDKDRGKNAGIICPHCDNGNGSDGDGVKPVKGEGVVLHCFKCGFTGSAVELLGLELGAPVIRKTDAQGKPALRVTLRGDDYKRAIEEGARRLSLSVEWQDNGAGLKALAHKVQAKKKVEPVEEKQDFTAYCEEMRSGLADERPRGYLEGRGLFIETAARLGIGFDSAWKNPKGGKIASPRMIIPFAGGVGYLARALDNPKKGAKQIGGAVGLFGCVDALHGGDVVFVVEGWADALSIIQAGYKAIALNGAENGGKLIEAAKDFSGLFLIALDGDEAGQKAAAKLGAMMQEEGFVFFVVDICGGFKDENEFLQKDESGFSFAVMEAYEDARAAAEKAARPDSLLEYVNGGAWQKDVEQGADNREKTGFPALDKWLGGGLYEGLMVISGFPSLGKTSLLWQMAENVAAGGCHVLFFSLEMSKSDMLAKSLSRRAYNNGRDITSDEVQSGRDACGQELKELLQEVGARLEVVEGSFGYGVETIRKRAMQAMRQGGRLCVFVDYLQAAADYKGGGSEITAISDTAKAFRQMARALHCPVVCASSTARTNYSSVVDYSCFYGSGGIEFAADVAAGLQLSIVYSSVYGEAGMGKGGKEKQAAMMDRASLENPRRVSLVGLKNRRGQMRRRINFLFDARHSVFSEDGSGQEYALSSSDVEELLAI